MTNPDFAELKEKLMGFDDQDAREIIYHVAKHQFSKKQYVANNFEICLSKYQHTKSSAIISELIDIIQSQSDALEELNEFTFSALEDIKHYFDNKCLPTLDEVTKFAIADSLAQKSLSETNAQLLQMVGAK